MRGRIKYIDSSSSKDLGSYKRGWPLFIVESGHCERDYCAICIQVCTCLLPGVCMYQTSEFIHVEQSST